MIQLCVFALSAYLMILAIKYIAKEIMRAFADILIDQLNERSKREIIDLSQRYK